MQNYRIVMRDTDSAKPSSDSPDQPKTKLQPVDPWNPPKNEPVLLSDIGLYPDKPEKRRAPARARKRRSTAEVQQLRTDPQEIRRGAQTTS